MWYRVRVRVGVRVRDSYRSVEEQNNRMATTNNTGVTARAEAALPATGAAAPSTPGLTTVVYAALCEKKLGMKYGIGLTVFGSGWLGYRVRV